MDIWQCFQQQEQQVALEWESVWHVGGTATRPGCLEWNEQGEEWEESELER